MLVKLPEDVGGGGPWGPTAWDLLIQEAIVSCGFRGKGSEIREVVCIRRTSRDSQYVDGSPEMELRVTIKDGVRGSRGDFNTTHLTARISHNTQDI